MSTFTPPPAVVPPPKKSGCWKWGAIGCLAVVLLLAIGIGVLMTIVFGVIKSTDVYQEARHRAESDPRVVAALGAPVHAGFWVSGNVDVKNSRGEADISFPIRGPRGKARVYAVATRDRSGWTYTELTVHPEHGAKIDLLRR
jgi:hypothetical protein